MVLDDSLVITGSQERKLIACKQIKPLVRIPEVNIKVGPLDQNTNCFDYRPGTEQ